MEKIMSKILSISTLFQSVEVHGNIPHESYEHRIVLLCVDEDISDPQLYQKFTIHWKKNLMKRLME
ncbi:hypothetical protein FE326_00450 [Dolosigranulum pigrum]|uniref:hypothetical protein n=1 Tax=Dolosigranulum pigrum TaxID=29394 RepID=UPI001AD853AC|nr:hypothetical protein [Dolosigranulum pigrum]QTJ40708.1 hypothetical protein FE326_00450 [Dolosigranulum pigrum]